jgi:hypothetical protein
MPCWLAELRDRHDVLSGNNSGLDLFRAHVGAQFEFARAIGRRLLARKSSVMISGTFWTEVRPNSESIGFSGASI